MDGEQGLLDGSSTELAWPIGQPELHALEEDATRQRVAVGVQPTRGEAEQGLTGAHASAVEQVLALDSTHQEARELEVAILVDAGHLGRLAADQG